MRKFILTSDKIDGSVELQYDDNGVLNLVDLRGTSMTVSMVYGFMQKVPTQVEFLQSAFAATTTIVESEFVVTFEMFWHEYPYKRNRHLAEPVFEKLSHSDKIKAWEAARAYKAYGSREQWYKYKIADLWLKTKQYLNDWKSL